MRKNVKAKLDKFVVNIQFQNGKLIYEILKNALNSYELSLSKRIFIYRFFHRGESNFSCRKSMQLISLAMNNKGEVIQEILATSIIKLINGKGNAYQTSLKTKFIQEILLYYNTSDEVIKTVSTQECLIYLRNKLLEIQQTSVFYMEDYLFTGIKA